jgi:hypothetical protein
MATRTKIGLNTVELRLGVVSNQDLSESDYANLVADFERSLNGAGGIRMLLHNNKEVTIYPRFHFYGPIKQVNL